MADSRSDSRSRESVRNAGIHSLAEYGSDVRSIVETAIDKYKAAQKPEELARLLTLLEKYELNSILEIGSDRGGTLFAWEAIAPNATIVSIDKNYSKALRLWRGSEKNIRGDSHNPNVLKLAMRYAPYDFIFIDGDHSYTGVYMDYHLYSPLSRNIVALHDICVHTRANWASSQVDRLWQKIAPNFALNPNLEIINEPTDWGGIGVVYV